MQEGFASFLNSIIIQTPVLASVCHIQHNTRRFCWPLLFSFSIILPSDVIKASTCRPSPRAHLHVLGMLSLMPCLKPTELVHSSLFRSCVSFCLYGPFNCILFHTFSRQLSTFSLCSSGLISALMVPSTIYLFYESLPQPLHNPLWLTGLKALTN